jgi:type IV pilus assembly protein PilM
MLFAKKKDLLGIDVGSTSIKLVQLKEVKGGYELESFGIAPLPPEAIVDNTLMDSSTVVETITNLVSSLAQRKIRDAASSISGNSVIIRKIMMTASTPEEVESEIQWESEQYIPFDINDVNIDFQILGPDENDPSKMHVLLVASKKDIVNDYQAIFSESGVKLVVLDVDAFAIQNAFEMNYDMDPEEVYALINIGANMMNLNVIKAGVSLFIRDVQLGGALYTEDIQKKMGVSFDEAERLKVSISETSPDDLLESISRINDTIGYEIRRSLDFYNSNALEGKISHVYLSGGGAKTLNLTTAISDRLSLPVDIVNPLTKIKWNDKKFDPEFLREVAPLMTVALGLAARRLGDK